MKKIANEITRKTESKWQWKNMNEVYMNGWRMNNREQERKEAEAVQPTRQLNQEPDTSSRPRATRTFFEDT